MRKANCISMVNKYSLASQTIFFRCNEFWIQLSMKYTCRHIDTFTQFKIGHHNWCIVCFSMRGNTKCQQGKRIWRSKCPSKWSHPLKHQYDTRGNHWSRLFPSEWHLPLAVEWSLHIQQEAMDELALLLRLPFPVAQDKLAQSCC